MHYNWYQEISNSSELEQGDLIPECPIIIPPSTIIKEGAELNVNVELIDSIILSQSCDLAHKKLNIVLVSPYHNLSDYLSEFSKKEYEKRIKELRMGNQPGYHLLNKIDDSGDYLVVDFRNVYGIHIDNLKFKAENLETRSRLLPPYKEHLSQAFARYLMRVGLPQDLEVTGYY